MSEVVTKNQSKAMGQRVLQMFSDALNSIADDLEKLPHATIRVFSNAGSTVTATSEDGTVLTATENNGVWEFKVPTFGYWTVKSGNAFREVYVNEFKTYPMGVGKQVYRYGYRIKEAEPDPYERVEYILDAKGMTPAHMDFENETFDYGSWANVWFVADNKPLMLKSDGTVGYYLNPNDYSKKADGTDSDVANADYDGNAMAQFPLCWIYRHEDDTYKYVIISNVQWDENYKAYAHTRADGSIADYFFVSIFGCSLVNDRFRSLGTGDIYLAKQSFADQYALARANGTHYDVISWSMFSCLYDLHILLGKSTDVQTVFGPPEPLTALSSTWILGTLNNKGQFYGKKSLIVCKTFHIEGLYSLAQFWTAGALYKDAKIYIKPTPEVAPYSYALTDDYICVATVDFNSYSFISRKKFNQYGQFATALSGASASTFYCDLVQFVNESSGIRARSLLKVPLIGGYINDIRAGFTGFREYWGLSNSAIATNSNNVMRLSCEQPV